jgi:hypothetical protein
MYQNNPAVPVNTLPTMYDLPSEDQEEMGLPSAEGVSLEVSSSETPRVISSTICSQIY